MYRTALWIKDLKEQNYKLETPLCVCSYHRPNAPIFSSEIAKSIDQSLFLVFVRNDPKELEDYSWLEKEGIATLVPILDDVKELGATRRYVVKYCTERGYKNIFMFDDTVINLYINHDHLTKTGNIYMGNAPWSTPEDALLLWQWLHTTYKQGDEEYQGCAMSCIGVKGFDWSPSLLNATMEINNGSYIFNYVCLDLETLKKYNINYDDMNKVGVEDIYMPWMIMKTGLPIRVFTDLSGQLVNTQKVKLSGGGDDTTNDMNFVAQSRAERLEHLRTLFVEKSLHKKFGDKLEGITYRKTKYEGTDLKLIWKYWRNYYKEHGIRRKE